MPVKVARFALDGHTPSADLYLSAGHGIYLDGMLVQVGSLINGETITRDSAADREVLEYFQIELADHDVIFAEGAATETLLPSADHKLFDNWQEYEALYGAEPVRARQAVRLGDPSVRRVALTCARGCAAPSRLGSTGASRSTSCATAWSSARKPCRRRPASLASMGPV